MTTSQGGSDWKSRFGGDPLSSAAGSVLKHKALLDEDSRYLQESASELDAGVWERHFYVIREPDSADLFGRFLKTLDRIAGEGKLRRDDVANLRVGKKYIHALLADDEVRLESQKKGSPDGYVSFIIRGRQELELPPLQPGEVLENLKKMQWADEENRKDVEERCKTYKEITGYLNKLIEQLDRGLPRNPK